MRTISSAIAVTVVSAVLTQTGEAHATYRFFHASQCAGTSDYQYDYHNNGQVIQDAVNGDVTLICPVTTDGNFAPTEISTISVDGWSRFRSSGVSGFTAAACRVFRSGGGAGGSCSTTVRGSAAGAVGHLAPSAIGIWTLATFADARFIAVGLGPYPDGLPGNADVFWSYKVTY